MIYHDAIAENYDADRRGREHYPPNRLLAEILERQKRAAVLDVGCGTGLWLAAQMASFAGRDVRWAGIDPSAGMLAIARRRIPDADLRQCGAEALPFPDASFDFVVSITASHHFSDKSRALAEMARVTGAGGTIEVANIEPSKMPGWWPYTRFPKTRAIDVERDCPADRVVRELEAHGFRATISGQPGSARIRLAEILAEARRRTISQLALLDDASYAEGVGALEADVAADPDAEIDNEFAFLTVTAIQRRVRA